MKRLTFLIVSLSLCSVGLIAQGQNTQVQVVAAFAYEQLTISNTSKVLTASVYNPTVTDTPSNITRASVATIDCDDNNQAVPDNQVRARWDGTAATSSNGVTIIPGISRIVYGYKNISQMKMIRKGSTDVVCQFHYYRTLGNAQ